jgi:hypothetical protein
VLYHDPEKTQRIAHSLGLQKGLIGVVNAFASKQYKGSNKLVIAHEMLHTVGASDKYTPGSGLPIYPNGYAKPELVPRYPQNKTEIMGGRRPITQNKAVMPTGLKRVIIGPETAKEINWLSE